MKNPPFLAGLLLLGRLLERLSFLVLRLFAFVEAGRGSMVAHYPCPHFTLLTLVIRKFDFFAHFDCLLGEEMLPQMQAHGEYIVALQVDNETVFGDKFEQPAVLQTTEKSYSLFVITSERHITVNVGCECP